jgi:hypothetical protein
LLVGGGVFGGSVNDNGGEAGVGLLFADTEASVGPLICVELVGLNVVGAFDGTRADAGVELEVGTGRDVGCSDGGGTSWLVGAGTRGEVAPFFGPTVGGTVGCLVG